MGELKGDCQDGKYYPQTFKMSFVTSMSLYNCEGIIGFKGIVYGDNFLIFLKVLLKSLLVKVMVSKQKCELYVIVERSISQKSEYISEEIFGSNDYNFTI